MKTFRIGIVGAGMAAEFHAKAMEDTERARCAGFCDGGSGRAKALAERFGGEVFPDHEALAASPEVDVVLVATPSGAHLEPGLAAAKAKKPVLCEKPLEITLERTDALIAAHEQAGTHLGGIFQNRFHPAMAALVEAVREDRFGDITYVAAHVPWWRDDAYYASDRRGTVMRDGGGALMSQSIHMVDALLRLTPPVSEVFAYTATLGHPRIETEDVAVAVLRFSTGVLGYIHGTTASWPGRAKRIEITGTEGTAVWEDEVFSTWHFREDAPNPLPPVKHASSGGAGAADPTALSVDLFTRNIEVFLDALEGKRGNPLSGTECRKAVELVLAVYRSAREGKPVALPLDGDS